jgi:nitroreductase
MDSAPVSQSRKHCRRGETENHMETWDAIRARRNVRSYLPDPIADSDLNRIAEAGWRAPSASNRQHRDFVIVTDRSQLEELSTVWRGAGHIAAAPAVIALVVPQTSAPSSSISTTSGRRRWR